MNPPNTRSSATSTDTQADSASGPAATAAKRPIVDVHLAERAAPGRKRDSRTGLMPGSARRSRHAHVLLAW